MPAPRGAVTIESLPELGSGIIGTNTPADADAIEALIRYLKSLPKPGDMKIEMVQLTTADATAVANALTAFFQRVERGEGRQPAQGFRELQKTQIDVGGTGRFAHAQIIMR